MKFGSVLFIFLIFISCKNVQEESRIVIDLNDAVDRMDYSTFVDSVSYLTLHLEEDMYIGEVQRLYKHDGYYYVWGTHQSGIFIFDSLGKLHAHIDCFGEGPEDFRMISSFSVVKSTGDVCVMDFPSQKLKYYSMGGTFKHSSPCKNWSVDFSAFGEDSIVFISPFYAGEENPNGIWFADKDNDSIRHLCDDVTSEHTFYYFPMTYHWADTCFYYYDRNWDNFSSVSPNGVKIVHRFGVKQKIPSSLIRSIADNPSKLNGYAVCDRFLYSPSRMLILYCRFDDVENRSYIWAMIGKNGKLENLATELYNDLDDVSMTSNDLFYLDEKTWARLCVEEEDNFDIRIQLLHLSDRLRNI